MNTGIRLGYQATLVSMESPTYGRLWLSVEHHPGNTVSSTRRKPWLAAEKRLRRRPRRRTDLLRRRIQQFEQAMAATHQRLQAQQLECLCGQSAAPSA